jgi:hypothetical protein
MAAGLINSATNERQNTMSTNASKPGGAKRKQKPPLAQADSLTMLRSAIGYVMQSGLVVSASNHSGDKLVIIVRGAQLTGDKTQFVPAITLADVPVLAQHG